MELDTRSNMSLWKDRALVEVNISVLHSFQVSFFLAMRHFFIRAEDLKDFVSDAKYYHNGSPYRR